MTLTDKELEERTQLWQAELARRSPPMMKIWLILLQNDEMTWVEEAWDDESTAENHSGWLEAVARVRQLAFDNKYEMRTVAVNVPGLYDLFDIPEVTGEVTS